MNWEWELEAILAYGNLRRGVVPAGWSYNVLMRWWDGPGVLRITDRKLWEEDANMVKGQRH